MTHPLTLCDDACMTEAKSIQEVFDHITSSLLVQGRKSKSDDSWQCRYQGAMGDKCAVGHCIPDDMYSPNLEGATVFRPKIWAATIPFTGWDDVQNDGYLFVNSKDERVRFMGDMQYIHDQCNVWDWPDHFERIASEYNLTFTHTKEVAR